MSSIIEKLVKQKIALKKTDRTNIIATNFVGEQLNKKCEASIVLPFRFQKKRKQVLSNVGWITLKRWLALVAASFSIVRPATEGEYKSAEVLKSWMLASSSIPQQLCWAIHPQKPLRDMFRDLMTSGYTNSLSSFYWPEVNPLNRAKKKLRKRSSKSFPSKTDMFTIIPSKIFREQSKSTAI